MKLPLVPKLMRVVQDILFPRALNVLHQPLIYDVDCAPHKDQPMHKYKNIYIIIYNVFVYDQIKYIVSRHSSQKSQLSTSITIIDKHDQSLVV